MIYAHICYANQYSIILINLLFMFASKTYYHSMNHTYHSCIGACKTPLKNDKYHTFEITIYYELNKPKKCKTKQKKVKKWGKNQNKKTQECLNNIRIRFPTYENECYAKRTRILRTMLITLKVTLIKTNYIDRKP